MDQLQRTRKEANSPALKVTYKPLVPVPFEVLDHALDADTGAHEVGVPVEEQDRHALKQAGQEVHRRDGLRRPESGADSGGAL